MFLRGQTLRRLLPLLGLASVSLLLPGTAAAQVTITLSPNSALVLITEVQDFTAVVTGTTQKTVSFKVCDGQGRNCVTGGNSALGTIAEIARDVDNNPIARYTAPANFPKPPTCSQVTDGCQVVLKAKLVGFRRQKARGNVVIPTPGVLARVSVSGSGAQSNGPSEGAAFSADGRFVVFRSDASNLVSGDNNAFTDVFLRDTCLGAGGCTPSTLRVSVADDGSEANGPSSGATVSADGRFVVFRSDASNLVSGDNNAFTDVFLRDTCLGAGGCTPSTLRVSVADDGSEANGPSSGAAASADGRFVAFRSDANNLVASDTNFFADVFLRDTCLGAGGCTPSTQIISISTGSAQGNAGSGGAWVSADGRYVSFRSTAANLVANDTNGVDDIFVRDTCVGAGSCTPSTVRVSLADNGAQGNGMNDGASLSSDGRFVAFRSEATNLVVSDSNLVADIFLRDTCVGALGCIPTTVRVSVATDGSQGDGASGGATITPNGQFVVFRSAATNLVPGDSNVHDDIFLRVACVGAPGPCTPLTARVSVSLAQKQANGGSGDAAVSADGRFVAFRSTATNLVANDTNNRDDIFQGRTGR